MSHDDVEFHVADCAGTPRVFESLDEAAGFAVAVAATGKDDVVIDVVIWSEDGARAYAGDDGVENYNEDPDASVFERIEIKVNNAGRVP